MVRIAASYTAGRVCQQRDTIRDLVGTINTIPLGHPFPSVITRVVTASVEGGGHFCHPAPPYLQNSMDSIDRFQQSPRRRLFE